MDLKRGLLTGSFVAFGLILSFIGIGFQINYLTTIGTYEVVHCIDGQGNSLYCRYYPARNLTLRKGIMIFHGFAEDQNTMRSYIKAFLQEGLYVFAVDFSGHGKSKGSFSFSENMDQVTVNQVLVSKKKFKELSLLNDSDIYQLGHSLGGRAILKAATVDANIVGGLILIGSLTNFEEGYFPYNSWLDNITPQNPGTNISLISTNCEDVFPQDDAIQLFEQLSGAKYTPTSPSIITSENNFVELTIFKGLFHTYETISPRVISKAVTNIYNFQNKIYDKDIPDSIITNQWNHLITWIFIPIGLIFATVFGIFFLDEIEPFLNKKLNTKNEFDDNYKQEPLGLRVEKINLFIYYKLFIWLGAAGFGAIIGLLFIFLPTGFPLFTLAYVCPMAGYGIFMLILYRTEKMPGVKGKWYPSIKDVYKNMNWKRAILTLILALFFASTISFFISVNWNVLVTWNSKAVWLFVLTIFTTLGFYVKRQESNLIRKAFPKNNYKKIILNNVIFLTPFFVIILILAIFGYFFIFIDSIHGFLIVLFVILFGGIFQRFCKNTFFTALIQSIILITLGLPRTPIFLLLN